MKTKLLAGVALLLATATASTAFANSGSEIRAFVRPTVGYTKPADSKFDGAAVFGIAGGITLGEKAAHEFSLEMLLSVWDTDHFDNTGSFICETTTMRMPILANYRYYFRPDNSIVGAYVGAGVGVEVVSLNTDFDNGGYYYYGYEDRYKTADSSVAFAAAGTAGISIAVGRMVEIELGYRGMWQSGGDNTIYKQPGWRRGPEAIKTDIDSGWVHFVTIGVSVRF